MQKHTILRFALVALSLIALPTLAKSQSLPTSSTPSIQISRSTFEKSKQAADEVAASRVLIPALEAEVSALKDRLALETQKTALLTSILDLTTKQRDEYKNVIVPNLEKSNAILTDQNAKLTRSNKRWKKVGKVLGAAVLGLGYVVLH